MISLRWSGSGAQEACLSMYLKKHACFYSSCRVHGFRVIIYISYLCADPNPLMDLPLGLSNAFNPATRDPV